MDAISLEQSKSLTHYNSPTGLLLSKTDPGIFASRIGEGMRAGVRSVIEACILLVEAVRLFGTDSRLLDQFFLALVDENVIPKRSARLGNVDKSKFSMLRKIGKHADLLLDDAIFRFLESGYSVLYYVIRLYEALPGDHQCRLARLAQLFAAQGSVSREFLIEQIALAERAPEVDAEKASDPWDEGNRDREYDLILMTPVDERDLQRLFENYADRAPLCPRILERVSKNAIAAVVARLIDLPVIENKLLPRCGFAALDRVFLLRDPIDPDVTNAQVIVVAMRGQRDSDCLAGFQWLSHGEPLDAVALASRLVPNAKNRLHLFASAETDGWQSIIGEANWRQTNE